MQRQEGPIATPSEGHLAIEGHASSPSVEVREAGTKGRGVFAARPIARGEVALVGMPVSKQPARTWQTLQVGIDSHARFAEPFELVNHSCDPGCGLQPNEHGGYNLVAMRDLARGEEVTFDYCMSEWLCVGFGACHCGSDRCLGSVRGGKFVPLERLREYSGFLAPHYRELLPDLADKPVPL